MAAEANMLLNIFASGPAAAGLNIGRGGGGRSNAKKFEKF
jgi:hypothetical protein